MTIHIYSKGKEVYFLDLEWAYLLDNATKYGWHPRGTDQPEWNVFGYGKGEHWAGCYCCHKGPIIRQIDGVNLTEALEHFDKDSCENSKLNQMFKSFSKETITSKINKLKKMAIKGDMIIF